MEETIDEYSSGTTIKQVTDSNPGVLEGTGTEEDPYIINSIEDLVFFSYDVRNGNTYEGEYVELGLSLNFNSTKSYVNAYRTDYADYGYDGELKTLLTSGEGFIPIGTTSYLEAEVSGLNMFSGTFDGNGYTLTGLYINQSITYDGEDYEEYKIGLFGYNNGTIQNLGIESGSITIIKVSGNCYVFAGGIAGENDGKILNCFNTGTVTSNLRAGGISGRNNGTIKKCYNSGKIKADSRVGGISADGSGAECLECYNIGEVTSYTEETSDIQLCGISGGIGKVNNCFNVGNIHAEVNGHICISGIGVSNEITNCYNIGAVSGIASNTGNYNVESSGICAYNGKSISNCYNIGTIIAKANGYYARASGISYNDTVTNSYNLGNITAIGGDDTEIQIGGISSAGGDYITNSCNIGILEYTGGKSVSIGSIVGSSSSSCNIENCYYLTSTADSGIGSGTDTTTAVYNIDDMPSVLSILGDEFKEDTNNINNGYPILSWQ